MGTTSPYINQAYIDRFKGSGVGKVSLWNPAWRAWTENLSARYYKRAMAMAYQGQNHNDIDIVQKTMELLQRNGMKQIRLQFDWAEFSYYDNTVYPNSNLRFPEQLRQCYAFGIEPIITLNQAPQSGTPAKITTATVDNGTPGGAVANGATTCRLTNIVLGAGESGSTTPIANRTGIYHANSVFRSGSVDPILKPTYFITAWNAGTSTATLSRPVNSTTGSMPAGTYDLYTFKMMPWGYPGDATLTFFNESWGIFRDEYLIPLMNIVDANFPSRAVTFEIWNELSFQYQWLWRGLWYANDDASIGDGGTVTGYQIMRNVRDYLEANGWGAAGVQNGITNTLPTGQSEEPARSRGMGGHPYGSGPLSWPYNISPGRTQLDAVGGTMSGADPPISTTTTGTNDLASGAFLGGTGVLNVASTAAFPSTGYVQVYRIYAEGGTLSYTGKTATTFTGCTRRSGPTGQGTVFAGNPVYYHEWQPANLQIAAPEWWLESYAFESRIHNVQPGFVGSTDFGNGRIKGRDVRPTEDTSAPAPGFVITESAHNSEEWKLKAKGAIRWYASWISKGCKQLCLYGVGVSGPPGVEVYELMAPWLELASPHTFPITNGTITFNSLWNVLFYPHPNPASGSSMGVGDTLMIGTDPTNLVTYTDRPNSTQLTGCNGGFGGTLPTGTRITLREGGPAMEAIGRMSRFLSMTKNIVNLRAITIPQVSDSHDAVQWSGNAANLTRWPHVYDRDVFFAQVLQVSSGTFALIYYVATRNMNAGNVDDGGSTTYPGRTFTVRLGGIRGQAYVKRKLDPLTGSTSFTTNVTNLGATSLDVTVEAMDYPRLILLREPMRSRIATGVIPIITPGTYTVTNVTTDRTYNANATTSDELADALGTLIADLQSQDSISGYSVTNVTTDRTYNANAYTIDELADVLGTLISDLQTSNIGTYTLTNVTTDRAYNANAYTDDELADVLGTLITDLAALGRVTLDVPASSPITVSITASANDGEVDKTGVSYPPASSATVATTAISMDARKRLSAGTYMNKVVLLRFDTSAIPDGATVTSATLRLYVEVTVTNADSRTLNVDYLTDGAIAAGDYADLVGTGAGSRAISAISGGGLNDITLGSLTNVSKTGFTKLRLGISGAAPTGTNEVSIASFDSIGQEAQLIVSWT